MTRVTTIVFALCALTACAAPTSPAPGVADPGIAAPQMSTDSIAPPLDGGDSMQTLPDSTGDGRTGHSGSGVG